MNHFASIALPAWQSAVLLTPALAAVAAAVAATAVPTIGQAWRLARAASLAMLAAAGTAAVVRTATPARTGAWLRSDTIGVAALVLVCVIAWVVIRFSETYLAGEPRQRRYIVGLLATLGAVTIVVTANNLLVLTVAWSATSLALHGLLTFYGDRPVALAVAHKKFLLARCADACMLGAVVAFGAAFDTLRLDRIAAGATAAPSLPASARVGVALVAVAALLKCAQLPFHGWLLQVMEAPTPVSALLHAGVVNLGGLVLLRVAPVVDRATETRALLVMVGAATAAIAALAMTTRVSIKVALAWSTCAQLGFMIVQCGLGLWEMALLHLLAHSLYKAHAFLSAGGTVRETQRRRLLAPASPPTVASTAATTLGAAAVTFAVGVAWTQLLFPASSSHALWVMVGVLALATVSLLGPPVAHESARSRLRRVLAVPMVATTYLAIHEVFGHLVERGAPAPTALLAVVGATFLAMFSLHARCTIAPEATLARRLYPWIYGGLFLDEAFTRVAFAVSPPPPARPAPSLLPRPHAVPRLVAEPATAAPIDDARPRSTPQTIGPRA